MGPVGFEEPGETAVGQDFAAGLAGGAVVGFVVGIADALDRGAADGARLLEAAVDGHFGAEGGYFFGKAGFGFGVEAVDPELHDLARGGEESIPLCWHKFLSQGDGREPGGMQDFVGVGVADAADDARVGEGALEGAVFLGECVAEGCHLRLKNVDAAGVHGLQGLDALDDVERGAAFGASFG